LFYFYFWFYFWLLWHWLLQCGSFSTSSAAWLLFLQPVFWCLPQHCGVVFVAAMLLHWFLLLLTALVFVATVLWHVSFWLPQYRGFCICCCGVVLFSLVLLAWSFFVAVALWHGPFCCHGVVLFSFLLPWHAGVCFCCCGIVTWFVFDAAASWHMLSQHSSF